MPFLLYDSNCPFCNKIVEEISKLIKDKKLKILAINSKKGTQLVKHNNLLVF